MDNFEEERKRRIEKDFPKTEEEILLEIRNYIPGVKKADLEAWEKEKSLEGMILNGEKRYFLYAHKNLFRINKRCREIWEEYHRGEEKEKRLDLAAHASEIIRECARRGKDTAVPVRMGIRFSVCVEPGIVPEGETIRCWIPFPKQIPGRQEDIVLLKTVPSRILHLEPPDSVQRTVYFEKKAAKNKRTEFSVDYEYTSYGFFKDIDPARVAPLDEKERNFLRPFLEERPPHIVFGPDLKRLSGKIVGREKNPYLAARRLYLWIKENIPWASARAYSTIPNISRYCFENRHGDCGIMTLLFMTLCRMNGIPTRWQSGWRFQPPHDTMHDWNRIYFKPYGWVPMDITLGLLSDGNEKVKWFYMNGMDAYHLVFNDDYSRPFQPEKKQFPSDTVDSQRGEVEWRGGNLYFDEWSWTMDWRELPAK